MTDNHMRDEGAKSMSEMLKVNSTLTSLDLRGEEEKGIIQEKEKKKRMNDSQLDWRWRESEGRMGSSWWRTLHLKHMLVLHSN